MLLILLLIARKFSFANKKKRQPGLCLFQFGGNDNYSVGDLGLVVRHEDGALSAYIRVYDFQIAKV